MSRTPETQIWCRKIQRQELNPHVRNMKPMEYAILATRATQINKELREGAKKPYRELIDVSSGDPHSAGVKPLSFVRQVLAACVYPQLLNSSSLPVDVKQRVKWLLGTCAGGSLGSYTAAAGISEIVKRISEFITRRDGGIPSFAENIFISSGSQWSLGNVLELLVDSEGPSKVGVLTPVPCYRTTNLTIDGLGAVSIPYHLREEDGWELRVEELHQALESTKGTCKPVAMYITNPGNPAGQIQSRKSMQEVIQFAYEKRLFLLADEVYQNCVIGDKWEFFSYKKVLFEMGHPFSDTVELASFHSASKGLMGECGLRGGYVELVNIDPSVMKYVYKLYSKDSCASIMGQIALELLANPPKPGDPSYPLYHEETQRIRNMLAQNMRRAQEVFNTLPGFSCQPGGAFLFPRVRLPAKAIQKAKEAGLEPDTFYTMKLLEDEGVFASPGCDYDQKKGTNHIRFSIMVAEHVMEELLRRLTRFHLQFMRDFS